MYVSYCCDSFKNTCNVYLFQLCTHRFCTVFTLDVYLFDLLYFGSVLFCFYYIFFLFVEIPRHYFVVCYGIYGLYRSNCLPTTFNSLFFLLFFSYYDFTFTSPTFFSFFSFAYQCGKRANVFCAKLMMLLMKWFILFFFTDALSLLVVVIAGVRAFYQLE